MTRPKRPPEQDPAGHGVDDEPIVEVPAGLIGWAAELLDLCDELLNRPGHNHIDARIRAMIRRYQPADTAALRQFHDGLAIAAHDLQQLLDDRNIVIDSAIAGRPRPHR